MASRANTAPPPTSFAPSNRSLAAGARWLRLAVSSALVIASLSPAASAAPPSAGDRETARTLMKEGDRFMAEHEAEQALRAYQAAHAIMNVPSTGIAMVRALTALGRFIEARDIALQVLRIPIDRYEPPAFTKAREEAAAAARNLEPRIAGVIVHTDADNVIVDGVALAPEAKGLVRKLNPGTHEVVVSTPGRQDSTVQISLSEGETKEVTLNPGMPLAPAPSPPEPAKQPSIPAPQAAPVAPAPQERAKPTRPAITSTEPWPASRYLVVGGASTAIVGLIVGSATGYLSIRKTADLRDACPNNGCPPDRQGDFDSAHNLATVSNIAFGAAGAGLVVAGFGYYLSTSDTPSGSTSASARTIRPAAGLGTIGIQGSF